MKCIDCPHMACREFYAKSETWKGFCMNKGSPKYRHEVKGEESCISENDLFFDYYEQQT